MKATTKEQKTRKNKTRHAGGTHKAANQKLN
jgi:hypothetical protein